MAKTDLDNLLTVGELAKKLKINRRGVYHLTMIGIPRLKAGRRLYFDPAEVKKWMIEKGKTESKFFTKKKGLRNGDHASK